MKSSGLALVTKNLRTNGDCIEYAGAKRNGYGVVKVGGRQGQVKYCHRIIWEAYHGPIPNGLLIRHICHNPACCKLEHLCIGNYTDNMRDMVQANRMNNSAGKSRIKGVTPKHDRRYFYWEARGYTITRVKVKLYHGKDFFEACCARINWENQQKEPK